MKTRDGGAVLESVRHSNFTATIVDRNGRLFLNIKTATHKGHKWDRVELPNNYNKAVETINRHLDNWPDLLLSQVKRNLSDMMHIRKLDFELRKMNMTAPLKKNMKKKKPPTVGLLEKNTEYKLMDFGKKPLYSFFWPGEHYGDSEEQMLDHFEQLKREDEYDKRCFDTFESNEDLMIDDHLKDYDYGFINEDNEGAGASKPSMEKNKSIWA